MSSQLVGYGYHFRFAYVYAEHLTGITHIYRNNHIVFLREYPGVNYQADICTKTGEFGKTANSYTDSGYVAFYQGWASGIGFMQTWTNEPIKYKNSATLVFHDENRDPDTTNTVTGIGHHSEKGVPIGDNVSSFPSFDIIAYNSTFNSISDHPNNERGANPVDVIYDIVKRDLRFDDDRIDLVSFKAVGNTVYSEGYRIGFAMTKALKISKWIEDILGIIDAVLYFDPLTAKLSIKLLRGDYDPNTIIEITDDNMSDIKMECSSWDNTYNTFTIKYQDVWQNKLTALEFTNTASKLSLGYARTKSLSYPMIFDLHVANMVASRVVEKMGTPLAALKFKVNFIDYPNLGIGDVFKVYSISIGVDGRVFRVTKITGDKEDTAYVNIEAIEDFYGRNLDLAKGITKNEPLPVDYYLPDAPIVIYEKLSDGRFKDPKNIWLSPIIDNTRIIDELVIKYKEGGSWVYDSGNMCYEGTLDSIVSYDFTDPNVPGSGKDFNREYKIRVKDKYGTFEEITYEDENSLQKCENIMMLNSNVFSFNELKFISGDVWEFTGLLAMVYNTPHNYVSATSSNIYILKDKYPTLYGNTIPSNYIEYEVYHKNALINSPSTIDVENILSFFDSPPPIVADKISTWKVKILPTVAGGGAAWKNIDSIVAGDDENMMEGYYTWEANGVQRKIDFFKSTVSPAEPSGGVSVLSSQYLIFDPRDYNYPAGDFYLKHYSSVSLRTVYGTKHFALGA